MKPKKRMRWDETEKMFSTFPTTPRPSYLFAGTGRKTVSRINSMPSIGSHARQATETQAGRRVVQNQQPTTAHVPLEVGSMVEVVSNTGVKVYGVIQWMGILEGKAGEWAGIELVSNLMPPCISGDLCSLQGAWLYCCTSLFQDYDVRGCSDGTYEGQRFFTCKASRALFVPVAKCSPDSRFVSCSTESPLSAAQTPAGQTVSLMFLKYHVTPISCHLQLYIISVKQKQKITRSL